MLRRFERDLLLAWGGLTASAFAVTGGRLDVAVGVAAGGALMGVSYLGIKGGADLLVAAIGPGTSRDDIQRTAGTPQTASGEQVELSEGAEGKERARRARARRRVVVVAALKFLGRFALLALLAYGMLAHLRLHPVGILVGASAPVVAAAAQLRRLRRAATPPAKSE